MRRTRWPPIEPGEEVGVGAMIFPIAHSANGCGDGPPGNYEVASPARSPGGTVARSPASCDSCAAAFGPTLPNTCGSTTGMSDTKSQKVSSRGCSAGSDVGLGLGSVDKSGTSSRPDEEHGVVLRPGPVALVGVNFTAKPRTSRVVPPNRSPSTWRSVRRAFDCQG